MGRPKGSKNKPKEGVIKVKAKDVKVKDVNKIIASDNAEINVKIDLRVTKDDILNLLLEKKEKELEKTVEEKSKSLMDLNKRRDELYKEIFFEKAHHEYRNHICYKMRHNRDINDRYYWSSNFIQFFVQDIVDYKNIIYRTYNVEKLASYSNPKAAVEHAKYTTRWIHEYKLKDYSVSHTYKYSTDWEDKFFTLGPLKKSQVKNLKEQIDELNTIYQEIQKITIVLREAQYKLLTFEKDRSIRNELTKALIAGVDVKTLLNA